jgi:acyl-CoA thioesterase
MNDAKDRHEARRAVDRMIRDDAFTRWLGASIISLEPGKCTLEMSVRPEMLNGFGLCHGGVIYALADSALAFASNSRGKISVSIDTSLSIPASAREGDTLRAIALESARGEKIGHYSVSVMKAGGDLVGLFKGTVYVTTKPVA